MPDKEQIICKYKFQDKEKFGGKPYCTCFCELCEDLALCDDNCQIYEDYKQLTSKIQECEELKEELQISKDDHAYAVELEKDIDHYRKALEEIEEYCRQNRQAGWVDIEGCLDIISKAKGGK